MEGSGSVQIIMDPDLGSPKTYGSYGSGSGSRSGTPVSGIKERFCVKKY
jgi:hypothetical protein